MAIITKEDALRYHAEGRPGKLEVVTTKTTHDPTRSFIGLFARSGSSLPGNQSEF